MDVNDLKTITCAGIVLYNPEIEKLKKNIEALYKQVDSIVLIDNASTNKDKILSLINSYDGIFLIENDRNYGIAKALNQILRFAEDHRYEWYVSMDQDSLCSETLIKEYAKWFSLKNVAIICPYVLNNNKVTFDEYQKLSLPDFEEIDQPIGCITSGSLNNLNIAKKINGYDEKLFIDCVDVDFNLKVHLLNYKIIRVNSAYMFQSMGEAKPVSFFQFLYRATKTKIFQRLSYTPIYSNSRLYYIARNSKYLRKKYGKLAGKRMTTIWINSQFIYYALTYPFSRNRIDMFKEIKRGKKDSGKLEEHANFSSHSNI